MQHSVAYLRPWPSTYYIHLLGAFSNHRKCRRQPHVLHTIPGRPCFQSLQEAKNHRCRKHVLSVCVAAVDGKDHDGHCCTKRWRLQTKFPMQKKAMLYTSKRFKQEIVRSNTRQTEYDSLTNTQDKIALAEFPVQNTSCRCLPLLTSKVQTRRSLVFNTRQTDRQKNTILFTDTQQEKIRKIQNKNIEEMIKHVVRLSQLERKKLTILMRRACRKKNVVGTAKRRNHRSPFVFAKPNKLVQPPHSSTSLTQRG